jgi:hypothetical protein
MYIIKASNPAETQEQIVKLLNQYASNHRIAAAKINGMHKKELELARASTYEGAAKFIENIIIQS